MNVTLTDECYTLDGKWRLVPVEPTYEMAILSLNGGLDYKLGVKAAPPPPPSPPPPQQSPGPDCRTCANRGRVNGLSQETYCEHCCHQPSIGMASYYEPKGDGGSLLAGRPSRAKNLPNNGR